MSEYYEMNEYDELCLRAERDEAQRINEEYRGE